MRSLRHAPPVAVLLHRAGIGCVAGRVRQIFNVIADCQHDLVRHEALFHQLQRELIRHFPQNKPGLCRLIGAAQHLPGAQAVLGRAVGLDGRDGAGLPAPRVVDEQLRILAEQAVEQLLILLGAKRDVPHREHAVRLEPAGDAAADAPEVRQRPVWPELPAEFHFIELCDAHAVFIGRNVLCHDVHGDLGEEQVRPDAGRRRDAGRFEYVADDRLRQLMGGAVIRIVRHIEEDLVDGIDDDVLRCDIFSVNFVDARTVFHIIGHARRRDHEIHRQRRVALQLGKLV